MTGQTLWTRDVFNKLHFNKHTVCSRTVHQRMLKTVQSSGCGGGYRNTGGCKNSTDAETLDTGIRGSGGTFVV